MKNIEICSGFWSTFNLLVFRVWRKEKREKKKNLRLSRLEKSKKKEINTPDSHLVPHGSTKGASSGLASKFGMGFGALRSL
jgi:hypothetical protein